MSVSVKKHDCDDPCQSPVDQIPNPESPNSGMRGYWYLTLGFVILAGFALGSDFVLASPENLDSVPGDLKRVFDLSELFAHGFGIVLVLAAVATLVPDKRRFIPRIATCAILPSLTVQLIKLFFSRDRPVSFLQPDLSTRFPEKIAATWNGLLPTGELNVQYLTQSFPSAHTATAFGLAIGLSWVFPRGKWLFFSVAILAALQRITSLAHWSSDVCVGAAIAFMMAGALTHNWGLGFVLGRFERRCETNSANQSSVESKIKIAA